MGLLNRALELYRTEGIGAVLSRATSLYTNRARRLFRRPRLEVQKRYLPAKYGAAAPDPLKVIEVDTAEIEHMIRPNFFDRFYKKYGTFVVGGDWDRETYDGETGRGLMRFEDYYLYTSTVEHLEQGVEWEETSGCTEWHVKNHGMEWFTAISDIHDSIVERGYRRQRELDTELDQSCRKYLMPPEFHEIRVNITRDGEFVFDDGRHRFCVVKALDIESIPVRVFVRHEEWQDLRIEIANADTGAELSERARRHLDHPDMQDVAGTLAGHSKPSHETSPKQRPAR